MMAAPGAGRLDQLQVIDLLEVGPVRVEKNRLSADYKVHAGAVEDTITLIYRFEEDVFDPGDAASRNLAAVMAAQVALNYGLFCRTIRFRGEYSEADRRFLEKMARNTAREIYVKKLLQPNPFLTGAAVDLPVENRADYLAAVLRFDSEAVVEQESWPVSGDRFLVLSSGGKDSLLSFGLLHELGRDPCAVFVNESGRHWFTALNAYRHFKAAHPGTARVWTNADRLFTWMLRHLPFIRPDFSSLRSDEYPVRLWTVAVFAVAALPLLRKRGIGNLVIGDEYDTTRRLTHRGIPHYDGLYDQSRYFDSAMSRFYAGKGYGVYQCSLLRPLSELLIEKILVERYPSLQEHQVSCHAAHMDGDRVKPCQRCEKCRRIVGMLSAVGADPRRCGYTAEGIESCLESLVGQGVHQESAGAGEMLRLLAERGLVSLPPGSGRHQPHPEVLSVRLDPVRSPLEAIPACVRGGLFGLFLAHADGIVIRAGRRWEPREPAEALAAHGLEPVEHMKGLTLDESYQERH
ncbi:hypothetical protein JW905_01585 [bacterium]|nr:hypothetical protein [candidate division CSSED10-310 bacterium]